MLFLKGMTRKAIIKFYSLIFNKVAGLRSFLLAQLFSCKLCIIFKYNFFTEHLWTTASGYRTQTGHKPANKLLSHIYIYIFRISYIIHVIIYHISYIILYMCILNIFYFFYFSVFNSGLIC